QAEHHAHQQCGTVVAQPRADAFALFVFVEEFVQCHAVRSFAQDAIRTATRPGPGWMTRPACRCLHADAFAGVRPGARAPGPRRASVLDRREGAVRGYRKACDVRALERVQADLAAV